MKLATKRTLAAVGVLGLVGVGLAVHTGTGTPSAWGIADIAAICPLGGIEAAIASRTIVPPLLIGLAVVVALVALVGRAFCAWGCPVLLRKWCHRFCPLGALLGLISRLNRTFRPAVAEDACLQCAGGTCSRCAEVCPEGIDLHHPAESVSLAECTKCGECKDVCPAHAISFPFLARKKAPVSEGLPAASPSTAEACLSEDEEPVALA